MAIPKVQPRTILLVGKEHSIMKELVAGAAITPGMLVQISSAGKWVPHATAGGKAMAAFAVEADLNGKGIDDAYATNDWCYAWIVQPGCEMNALVAAAGAAIVVGDFIESAGNGTVRKFATGQILGQALQALDNSAGGAAARLQIITL